ncbi:ATP phosphoribosyltransferase [Immundisolibacter sp.]|uniref:ATP phosphoribosyltransferase n=1 Tax=Immundisolibacter sp. TaxID=1934948 RepID=UPI0035646750
MDGLRIAVSKGRILEQTLPLLASIGIAPVGEVGRRLIVDTSVPGVQIIIIRATDVPTYVAYGAADAGIAGKDVLMEHGGEGLYEPLDLGIARCRLMVAGRAGVQLPGGRLRVATKYVNVAQRYYAERGVQVEPIKLYGSMELAPLVGLADCIVDLVDTGSTLRANGLEPLALIADISSRLVVNRASMKLKQTALQRLIRELEAVTRQVADAPA